MKFTLGWLKDHLETQASLADISTALSAIGLEVEKITDRTEELAAFTVARVRTAQQHPNADKLRVCQVEIYPDQPTVEVVCGAENAQAGLITVFAPLGAFIPGTRITLEKKPVRGVVSNGMLVSVPELQLDHIEDNGGIIELDEEYGDKVGQRYVDIAGLGDPVIEIGLTPNRPDCTGVRGIARDLAAAGLGKLKPLPKLGAVEGSFDCPVNIQLEFEPEFADACPVFASRYVKGATNGPSPAWMRRRLTAIGLRPRSALVDITNYICMDLGRPLHVYDADKLKGHIRARMATDGETFLALDNKEYTADATMCVIADDSGVLGYGGIIGGEHSGCTEETENVLIECAYFDPVRTAETGRKNGIISDARYRFERGVDPAFIEQGLDLATDMVLKLCGGAPSRASSAGAAPVKENVVDFSLSSVKKLTGLDVAAKDSKRILQAIGCKLDGKEGRYKVTIPTWRPDMYGSADLVEEIIRIVGLDNVVPVALPRNHGVTQAVLTDAQKRSRRARRVLASRGLVEVITWSFLPHAQALHFDGGDECLELDNPISIELATMRPSLLPGLLSAVQRNANRGFADAALFELGQAYRDDTDKGQLLVASGVRLKTAKMIGSGRHWAGTADPVDVFDVKSDLSALLASLGVDVERAQITRDAPAWFHPGRSGTFRLGPKVVLGYFGEVHPMTLRYLDVDGPAMAFEAFLSALPPEKRKARAKAPLAASDLLPVRRDFAFVLDQAVPAGDVIKAAAGADRTLISDVNVFDVFEGGNLGDGKKSIAIEVTLQTRDKTLTDAEIEALSTRIIGLVKKATGGEIRG